MDISGLTHNRAAINGIHLHYVEAGQGPLVVLLHGFPDFWYTWRIQIPALVGAGYRVVAPDLRGYNESDKPRKKRDYSVRVLVEDIASLIKHTGEANVVLVGHDWGGVLAWLLAASRPELVRRLIILNAPHPKVYERTLLTSAQLLKSWYVFLFQVPWLPERMLRAFDFAVLERVVKKEVHREGALTERDMTRYKRAWGRPGALRAAMQYYRMAPYLFLRLRSGSLSAHVSMPTLVIWGERDPHLDSSNLVGLERWVPDLRIERIPGVGHWVHLDAAEKVNALLAEFGRS